MVLLEEGAVFGSTYRLEKILGKGGMGEVWLASHILLDEPRAIKLMLGAYVADVSLRQRFVQGEARNSLRLERHPGLVRVYELGLHEEVPFIVMEYIEGGPQGSNLKEFIRNTGKLSLEQIRDIINTLASALDMAHAQGLIHRDIKPANILIDKQGQPKLGDFGLTKDLDSGVELTSAGFSSGTPAYMSPEQAQGRSEKASDVYSLGCVLYEMLTGRPPFSGTSATLLMQHAATPPPPLRKYEPNIPTEVEAVVLRALSKRPQDRYSSAGAMAQAYAKALKIVEDTEHSETVVLSSSSSGMPSMRTASQGRGTTPPSNNDNPSGPLDTTENPTTPVPFKVVTPPPVTPPHNLPTQPTSFVGREAELTQAKSLLKSTRLLTLTGAGGTGKTRLSVELAGQVMTDYPDGVWLLELAPLGDATALQQEMAQVLGIKEEQSRPLLTTLADYLREKKVLLVLDNCEHLLDASARIADRLLKSCPQVCILATSREGLAIGGETTWRVPSLSMPDPNNLPDLPALTQFEAVKLFIDRALAALPNFTVTNQNAPALAQLCHQLDGIPLALELAAARIKSMTVEQISSRLDQRFRLLTGGSRAALPRQQTLKALIDWSYELLTDLEKTLLARITVFSGGWALETAEAVCPGEFDGGEILDFDVTDGLAQLVNKSLVLADEHNGAVRYRMLESIRQYGRDKLTASGEEAAFQAKHCAYFLEIAEQAEPQLTGAEQSGWMTRLEQEHDNMRAALTWTLEGPDKAQQIETALRLCGGLWNFWVMRSYLSEGRKWLEAALEAADFSGKPEYRTGPIRAKVLKVLGTVANQQAEYAAAQVYWEQSLILHRELGDKRGIASLLNNLGIVAHLGYADYPTARARFEECLAQFRELNELRPVCAVLNNLGLAALDQGDLAGARQYLEEALTIARSLDHKWSIGLTLSTIGSVALEQGDYEAAAAFLKESLVITNETGARKIAVYSMEFMAGLLAAQAQSEKALRLAGATASLRETLAAPLFASEKTLLERRLKPAYDGLGDSAQGFWQEGHSLNFERAVKLSLE